MATKENNCGIDCPCEKCEKLRQMIRGGVASGKIHLSGTEEDKKKILG